MSPSGAGPSALGPSALGRWAAGVVRGNSTATWALLRLFGSRRGADRFFLVYAYFRWADDIVDAPGRDPAKVRAFAAEQRAFRQELPADTGSPAERCLVQALASSADPRLRLAVSTMAEALDFDAGRAAEPLTVLELQAQIRRVGDAYTQALLHATEVRGPVPDPVFLLARAATATHHLRDLLIDQDLGYFNLPRAHAEAHGLPTHGLTAQQLGGYFLARAELIRPLFAQGRRALASLPLRARLLLSLFAWRYERVLDRLIEAHPVRESTVPTAAPSSEAA